MISCVIIHADVVKFAKSRGHVTADAWPKPPDDAYQYERFGTGAVTLSRKRGINCHFLADDASIAGIGAANKPWISSGTWPQHYKLFALGLVRGPWVFPYFSGKASIFGCLR